MRNIRLKFLGSLFCVFSFTTVINFNTYAQTMQDLQDVQQIVAIVNDKVISLFDLKQRARLLSLSTGGRQLSQEDQQYLQAQALQALIDDRLKIQEAEKYNAGARDNEVEAAFANYARQFNLTPDELEKQLNQSGVEIADEEVNNIIDNLERDKGKDRYRVSEIFLLVSDNARREETLSTAQTLYTQLNNGSPFSAVAQQFSQSSSAAVGGDLGWILENELPKVVQEVVVATDVGVISEPIETEDGIYIIQVVDKSTVLSLNENDIVVKMKSMFFNHSDENDIAFRDELSAKIEPLFAGTDVCENMEKTAETAGATESGELAPVRIGDLPVDIRQEVTTMEIGTGTSPIKEEGGYSILILCEKNIPEVGLPDFDVVQDNLTQSRVQLMARRHLRDLRRDAIVDYR
jgi:peptidyl-prolyl cis-trans isomerase SurA